MLVFPRMVGTAFCRICLLSIASRAASASRQASFFAGDDCQEAILLCIDWDPLFPFFPPLVPKPGLPHQQKGPTELCCTRTQPRKEEPKRKCTVHVGRADPKPLLEDKQWPNSTWLFSSAVAAPVNFPQHRTAHYRLQKRKDLRRNR